jgi:hypothetical protein
VCVCFKMCPRGPFGTFTDDNIFFFARVVLDHFESSSDDTLQVNFNFSFPHLKCEYASIDATNFMGTHDAGLSGVKKKS